jgi:hypothetical protein
MARYKFFYCIVLYTFDVQFRPGRENNVAHCLSRSFEDSDPVIAADLAAAHIDAPVSETDFADPDTDDRVIATMFSSLGTAVITLQAVDVATAADEQLSCVRKFVVDGWPMISERYLLISTLTMPYE